MVSGVLVALVVAVVVLCWRNESPTPSRTLTNAALRMGTGDLSTRVSLNAESTPAEIAHLGSTFNEMAAKLEHDVDELRHQEQLQRELVANVAHELATPLTAIRGYQELLAEDETLSREQRDKFAYIIHHETVRLGAGLPVAASSPAGIRRGKDGFLHPVALHTLAGDTIDVLQGTVNVKRSRHHNGIPEDLPLVLVDTDRLTQVMINLLDNAVRHTPMGGTVTIHAHQEDS